MSTTTTAQTIQIGRLAFTVEKVGDRYDLRGKRGAHYFTMRNVKHPQMMFLGNCRRFGCAMPGVWLTDVDGALKVLS